MITTRITFTNATDHPLTMVHEGTLAQGEFISKTANMVHLTKAITVTLYEYGDIRTHSAYPGGATFFATHIELVDNSSQEHEIAKTIIRNVSTIWQDLFCFTITPSGDWSNIFLTAKKTFEHKVSREDQTSSNFTFTINDRTFHITHSSSLENTTLTHNFTLTTIAGKFVKE